MKTIEIRRFDGEDRIFINNELFDWGIDEEAINKINNINDKEELDKILENIMLYFISCIEPILGRKTNIKEIYESILSGNFE